MHKKSVAVLCERENVWRWGFTKENRCAKISERLRKLNPNMLRWRIRMLTEVLKSWRRCSKVGGGAQKLAGAVKYQGAEGRPSAKGSGQKFWGWGIDVYLCDFY